MVKSPPKKYVPADAEKEVIAFWRQNRIFERSIEERAGAEPFVFLEGPPTANGLPHAGHVLTRTLKDTVCRYHTMLGHRVDRKAGWDCHGLPVEIEVQKEHGLKDVQDIERFGIEPFNRACRESVFKYKSVWEAMTERVGFWLDFDDPYVTMNDDYIESVWWSLKTLYEKGLLFKDYKVVPYCPQTGTSYSSHEVAQGYKTVDDLSVFVKFPLEDDADGAKVLSWTTTPWTLPGNVALAVGPDIDYVKVRVKESGQNAHAEPGEVLILAKALMKNTLRNETEVLAAMKGSDLVGRAYAPLFPGAVDTTDNDVAFTIVDADFVTTEDGTGVVHTAVMYGDEDFRLGEAKGLPKQHTVDLQGRFVASVGAPLAGRYVKECDQDIADLLRERGLLYRSQMYEHEYPHCWRTGYPLLYYGMESWFIRMSSLRDELLQANAQVAWYPDNIKEGRFGEWLRNVKDWAISRKRFWGTPLPVWVCHGDGSVVDGADGSGTEGGCGHSIVIGSREELAGLIGADQVPDDLHRPFIDIEVPCSACGKGTMRREPYVLDCWYDSGAAHFAQWHHPKGAAHGGERREDHFPVDFIAEGLDQTRGWFYSLLATGVALFGEPTYKRVLVNGLVLAEDGQKMSKSKKNYTDPDVLFESLGADAVRWSLLTASAPWADKRFFDGAVRESYSKFIATFWNTYSFFATYASLDGWTAEDIMEGTGGEPHERPMIDQWLLDRLYSTVETMRDEMSRFNLHKATRALESFVVDDLSNWYVRRIRKRLWTEDADADAAALKDKHACYATLHETLAWTAAAAAPFTPFVAEHVFQALKGEGAPWKDSVHLHDFPARRFQAPEGLAERMSALRGLVEAGRALRAKVNINNRHPLATATLVPTSDATVPLEGLRSLLDVFAEELNVKSVDTAADTARFTTYTLEADPGRIGPRFKQQAGQVKEIIQNLDPEEWGPRVEAGEAIPISIEGEEQHLAPEDLRLAKVERSGYASTKAEGYVLVLDTTRSPGLVAEGLARELIRRIQDMRKQQGYEVEDRIEVAVSFPDGPSDAPVHEHADAIAQEVRATALAWEATWDDVDADGAPEGDQTWDIDGWNVRIQVAKADATGTDTARAAEAATN